MIHFLANIFEENPSPMKKRKTFHHNCPPVDELLGFSATNSAHDSMMEPKPINYTSMVIVDQLQLHDISFEDVTKEEIISVLSPLLQYDNVSNSNINHGNTMNVQAEAYTTSPQFTNNNDFSSQSTGIVSSEESLNSDDFVPASFLDCLDEDATTDCDWFKLDYAYPLAAAPPKKVSKQTTRRKKSNPKDVTFRSYQANQWELRYQELVSYQNTHGHCLVDSDKNKTLCHWIKRQRNQYKQKMDGKHTTLTDERQHKLEQLGFVWDSHDLAWEYQYNDLLAFKAKHGHTNVPTIYMDNPQLGIWVKGQRRRHRLHLDGEKTSLTLERIDRLNAVSFMWSHRPVNVQQHLLQQKTTIKTGSHANKLDLSHETDFFGAFDTDSPWQSISFET